MSDRGSLVIGVRDLSMRGWTAGGVVTRTMALALRGAGADIVYASTSSERVPQGVRGAIVGKAKYIPAEWTFRKWLGKEPKEESAKCLRSAGATILLPAVDAVQISSTPSIGWIPDFQHLHLPELFSPQVVKTRNERFLLLAQKSRLVWLTSEDAAGDFRRTFPTEARKARVAPFPSLFAYEPPGDDGHRALEAYHLPEKYLLVVNQFWRHKNHRAVAEALGILRKQGLRIPAVMAGMPSDHRDQENSALNETLQALVKGGAWADCLVLGKIPRVEVQALLQRASVLVQPSRFEGWNTSVEDAKALGCPVVLSDIAVHREQCPDALGFFPCGEPQKLADILGKCWESLPARPDPEREQTALQVADLRGLEFGKRMMDYCREASG